MASYTQKSQQPGYVETFYNGRRTNTADANCHVCIRGFGTYDDNSAWTAWPEDSLMHAACDAGVTTVVPHDSVSPR